MRRPSPEPDAGFTLIDTLIALVIMGGAVVVLVGALASVINVSQAHRGNAVAENIVRSYTQAVQAKVSYETRLVSDTGSQLVVQDGSGFGTGGFFVNVEQEVVRVTTRSGNTLTVERGSAIGADPTSVVTHPAGAKVTPTYRCPQATDLAPEVGAYTPPTGVDVSPSSIDFWDPASARFVSRATCLSNYDADCSYRDSSDNEHPDIRFECESVARLTVTLTTSGEPRLRNATTTTTVLVRRGSAL